MQSELATGTIPSQNVEPVLVAGENAHAGHKDNSENKKFAIWLFLSSESILFSVMIAAMLLVRWQYPEEHALLNIPLTSLSSFVLLGSSYMVVRALAGIQAGNRKKFTRSLFLVVALGIVFLGFQVYEFQVLAHEGLRLNSGPFGFAFFTLTGFHGFHVIIGVVWALRVFINALNGQFTATDHFGVEFFGLYWHFVDVVWIFIFTIIYLL